MDNLQAVQKMVSAALNVEAVKVSERQESIEKLIQQGEIVLASIARNTWSSAGIHQGWKLEKY